MSAETFLLLTVLAHRARSRFFLQLTRYINYLLTYLQALDALNLLHIKQYLTDICNICIPEFASDVYACVNHRQQPYNATYISQVNTIGVRQVLVTYIIAHNNKHLKYQQAAKNL